MKIHIVDDSVNMRRIVTRGPMWTGCEDLVAADSAADADRPERAEGSTFDLALSDVEAGTGCLEAAGAATPMPEGSGPHLQ